MPDQAQEHSGTPKDAKGSSTAGVNQGCHPFYESLIVNPFIAEVSIKSKAPSKGKSFIALDVDNVIKCFQVGLKD